MDSKRIEELLEKLVEQNDVIIYKLDNIEVNTNDIKDNTNYIDDIKSVLDTIDGKVPDTLYNIDDIKNTLNNFDISQLSEITEELNIYASQDYRFAKSLIKVLENIERNTDR